MKDSIWGRLERMEKQIAEQKTEMKGIRAQLFDVMAITIRVSEDLKIVLSRLGVQDEKDQYQFRARGTFVVEEEHANLKVDVSY